MGEKWLNSFRFCVLFIISHFHPFLFLSCKFENGRYKIGNGSWMRPDFLIPFSTLITSMLQTFRELTQLDKEPMGVAVTAPGVRRGGLTLLSSNSLAQASRVAAASGLFSKL
jgi:hypothetical protein